MRPGAYDIPLHDIKPLMEVPESSFALLMLIVGMAAILLGGGLFLLYRYIREHRSVNLRKVHYKALQAIDFSDAKRAAYDITEYGRLFAADSERLQEAYNNLVTRLERYKYRPRVETIDEESLSYYRIYLEMIDL